jgi:hypothetical protein
MPTELPYAADAEVSLTYDELEVSHSFLSFFFPLTCVFQGVTAPIPEGSRRSTHYDPNQV